MRIALLVAMLTLSGCGAILRALNSKPDPDTAAIDAFQNLVHCPDRPGSTDNIDREGFAFIRVRGCGQERDCRFVDNDERRMECYPTAEAEQRQADLAERERRNAQATEDENVRAEAAKRREAEALARREREAATAAKAEAAAKNKEQATAIAIAAFAKATGCKQGSAFNAVPKGTDQFFLEIEGCGEYRVCVADMEDRSGECVWPPDVEIAKRRLELETSCPAGSITPKKSQHLTKGENIHSYSAYRLQGCGHAYVCTVDNQRADCKAALDSK